MANEIDIGKAREILASIESSSLSTLKLGLYKSAVNYARIRSDWKLMSITERVDSDHSRTAAHNVFIDSCNILSRNMAKAGEPIGWRAKLGDDRKTIGDFACYIHCLFGLESR